MGEFQSQQLAASLASLLSYVIAKPRMLIVRSYVAI